MHFRTMITALVASVAVTTEGAIITLYSGPNCSGATSSRNVYDNSCATGVMGFQSFRITSGGGSGQQISTYSPDACAGTPYICRSAGDVGTCFNSFGNNYSGSNALSSSPTCGTV